MEINIIKKIYRISSVSIQKSKSFETEKKIKDSNLLFNETTKHKAYQKINVEKNDEYCHENRNLFQMNQVFKIRKRRKRDACINIKQINLSYCEKFNMKTKRKIIDFTKEKENSEAKEKKLMSSSGKFKTPKKIFLINLKRIRNFQRNRKL